MDRKNLFNKEKTVWLPWIVENSSQLQKLIELYRGTRGIAQTKWGGSTAAVGKSVQVLTAVVRGIQLALKGF